MSDRTKTIEKIRKLLTLGTAGRGGTQAEMETAMKKAMEIALEHGIDLASVGDGEVKAGAIDVNHLVIRFPGRKQYLPMHEQILNVIQACFGVRTITHVYRSGGHKLIVSMTIVGEQTDIEIAQFVWNYLEGMFKSCWKGYAAGRGISSSAWVVSQSYYMGLRVGVIEVNRQVVAALSKAHADRYAVVLVNKEALVEKKMNELFPNLKNNKATKKKYDGAAYQSGVEKGKTIKLNSALNA